MKWLDCSQASNLGDAIVLLVITSGCGCGCGACAGGRDAVVVWLGGGRDHGRFHDLDAGPKACIA